MSWQLVRRDLLGVKKHLFQRTEEPGGIREPLDECARNYTNVVPSVMALEEEELELISEAMEVHQEPPNWEPGLGAHRSRARELASDSHPKDFNLAQMLQGENVPASVLQLQAFGSRERRSPAQT